MRAERSRRFRAPGAGRLLPVVVAFLVFGCDIPTQGPNFSFTPTASAPIVFEKSFVFLGPDGSGIEALIDTTTAAFDSIFSVDPSSDVVFISQDLDAFDLIQIDNVIEPINFESRDIVVTLDDFSSQSIATSYDNRIGVLEESGGQTPALTPLVSGGKAYLPLATGDILTVPTNGVVDLTGADVDQVSVTNEVSANVNRIRFTLSNHLAVEMTDGSTVPGTVPAMVLESSSGAEISRALFNRSPGPGESALADLSLAGLDIPADSRFALDASTPQGFAPIENDPSRVGIATDMTPVRYSGFDLSNIPASTADASKSDLTIAAEVDFTGITTRGGAGVVRIENTLPLPVQIQSLTVTNASGVASYPADHQVLSQSGPVIPAKSAMDVPVFLGVNALSRVVHIVVTATTPARLSPAAFAASDGLNVTVSGDVDVDVLYYRPAGEVFKTEEFFAIDAIDVTFASASDYVQVESGSLDLIDMFNGIDLTLEEVAISFPDIRVAPYAAGDTLVVHFHGSSDKASEFEFAKLERNAPPRTIAVDLAGTRISAIGDRVRYRVEAASETTTDERAVAHDDEVRTSARATGLTISRVVAIADPFSSTLTEDVNGDGVLDPTTTGEGVTSTLDDYGPLAEVTGLELRGAELSINVTTNITGDLTLYGILQGDDGSGNVVYLQGRSALAVAPGDTMIQSFEIDGSPAQPDRMFAVPIAARGTPGQPQRHTVVLNDLNSSINQFVSALPTTIQFVGKAIVGSVGGRIEISQPATVDIAVGLAVPMSVRGDFQMTRTEPANLSSLDGLTDPESNFTAEQATLTLAYSNGIPLGLQARLEFVDKFGEITVSLPFIADQTMDLLPAPAGADGYATGTSVGEVDFALEDAALQQLASSRDLRITITFATGSESRARIRASDRIDLALRGDFQFNVSVGD
jgi:hypothetical protein